MASSKSQVSPASRRKVRTVRYLIVILLGFVLLNNLALVFLQQRWLRNEWENNLLQEWSDLERFIITHHSQENLEKTHELLNSLVLTHPQLEMIRHRTLSGEEFTFRKSEHSDMPVFELEFEVKKEGEALGTITIAHRDPDFTVEVPASLWWMLVVISLLQVAFGFALWKVTRRIALRPLEKEVGSRIKTESMLRDTYQRHQELEMELRRQEERYHRLVDLSPASTILVSRGIIRFVNPAALRLLRAAVPEQLIGMEFANLVLEHDRETYHEAVELLFKEGRRQSPITLRLVALDGTERTVTTQGSRLQEQGEPAVLWVVLRQ